MSTIRLILASLFVASVASCGEVAPTIDAAPPIDAPIDSPDAPSDVTLTVALAGSATGTVTSTPAGINCGSSCTLTQPMGTMVTLTAAPAVGATFAGFTGGGCTGTATTCIVTLNAATTVTATFNTARYNVTVNLMGNGTGTVTSSDGTINCPGTCTTMVDHGTVVNLTAAAGSGSTFAGWGGSCVGTGACSLTVTADTTVSAGFTANNGLMVTRAGNGSGTVTSSPAGINCGADCGEAYPPGTIVTLTATPATGSTFTGWSGAGCTGTGICTITLNASQMVTATFTLNQYTLTVARAGTGTGTVTGTGINCGADCTEVVNHGTSVTLGATAGVNSTFTGWSGGGCTGTGPCTVTVTAATTVTASFAIIQHTLTVTLAGSGTGTVTSSPIGINCGTDCTEPYNAGTTVVLTATPTTGSTFAGWSGGCTGTATTCTVTMNAAVTATATFNATSTTVNAGWNCGSGVSCTDVYDFTFSADANVTITVTAVTGASVLRLGAYNPGVPITGASLLTGVSNDRMCVGQNASDTVIFKAVTAGTYRIAVGRDWGSSAGASGTYTLNVSATGTSTFIGAAANDIASGATGTRCGYIATFSSGWTCASGVSCQDVYSFDSLVATPATVAATAITGASVVRLAVFNGTVVTTTNQLNNMLTDRRCVGQNINDTATTPAALPAGPHLFAIGRDWGSSAGASGTYTYTITTPNAPLVPRGQTANDTGSAFATTTCP